MTQSLPPHVLVVGIDGVRYDTLLEVETPHLDRLAARGFLQPAQLHPEVPSISGPSWATSLTGVLPPAHRIVDNDLTGHNLAAHPDFIRLARDDRPEINSFVGADWQPLVTTVSGGPLLADGGFLPPCRRGPESTPEDWHHADELVTDAAAGFLRTVDSSAGSASFVYLHGCDTAGHRTGVGPRYREFVAASDRRLGRLLAAIDDRPTRTGEDWLIIAVTDHGHRDEGGHGGDSEQERLAWIAAAGAGVVAHRPGQPLQHADVAGHALHVLDVAPRSEDFVGLPFGTRPAADARAR